MSINKHCYGWRHQLPDHRDVPMGLPRITSLPDYVDLRHSGFMPPVYDQGQTNSCTGNLVAGLLQYERARQGLDASLVPSRLMLYYNGRSLEGSTSWDGGAVIRDVIKGANQWGACFEDAWPFDAVKVNVRPTDPCYAAAQHDRAIQYNYVGQTAYELCAALAAGYPVGCGIMVYPEIESPQVAQTGRVPLPANGEASIGGHAVMIVGYDQRDPNARNFLVRNSWSNRWALKGYFLLPYEYVLRSDLTSDFWSIQLIG